MRTLTEGWVRQVNPRLSIHDFRMVRSARQTKLVFDLAIPYDMALSAREVQTFIAEQLQKEGRDYQTIIHLDRQM